MIKVAFIEQIHPTTMATNDTAPSRSLENCDDECLTSPPSSTSLPSADFTNSMNSNLRSTVCSTSGYERVSLDNEDTDAVSKESAVSQPKPTHRSLIDSLGLLSGHLAHSNDLDDQLNSESSPRASPRSSPGTTNPDIFHHDSPVSASPKGRHAWITGIAAGFSREFRKLRGRGHDPERGDDLFDDEAFNRGYCT